MRNILLAVSLLATTILFCYPLQGQTLRWGISGGSADGSGCGSGGTDETTVDMATDPNGNVYVISNVFYTGLTVAGHSRTSWGDEDCHVLK